MQLANRLFCYNSALYVSLLNSSGVTSQLSIIFQQRLLLKNQINVNLIRIKRRKKSLLCYFIHQLSNNRPKLEVYKKNIVPLKKLVMSWLIKLIIEIPTKYLVVCICVVIWANCKRRIDYSVGKAYNL